MATFPALSASSRGANDLSFSRAIAAPTMARGRFLRPASEGLNRDPPGNSPSVATRGTHRGNGEADEVALDVGTHAGTVEIRDVITPVHGEEVTLAQFAGQTDRPG